MATPDAQTVIDLTGTSMPAPAVAAIIDDAALIAGPCLAGVSDELATAAIKWLAAHLIASTSDQGAAVLSSKKLGDASKQWSRGQMGDALMATSYGQQAIALLPCLARIGRAKASIQVV